MKATPARMTTVPRFRAGDAERIAIRLSSNRRWVHVAPEVLPSHERAFTMAFTWLEQNQTKITTNQWGEDIYGLKATNVFGLAWNYYLGYTKFITGLDMTLDMGMKAEFFFAGTIKIGYANELTSIGNVKTGVTEVLTNISQKCQHIEAARQELVQQLMAMIATHNEMVEERNSSIGSENTDRLSFFTATAEDEVRSSGTLTESSGSMSFSSAGPLSFVASNATIEAALIDLA